MQEESKEPKIPIPTFTLHNDLVNPLLTDMYQLTMAHTYFDQGRHQEIATFEMFYRKAPFKGTFVIFAGLGEILRYLKNFKFTEEQIEYLKKALPNAKPEFYQWLSKLDSSQITFSSLNEGQLAFPRVPIMQITGPVGLIQLLETTLLNLVSYPSLIATNASRMIKEGGPDKKYIEFGLRRAQGPDGGLSASQYSYLGGFDGTSNVQAGYKYSIPIYGTIAHSFITSYDKLDEAQEFELNGIKIKERSLEYRKQLGYVNTNDGELAAFIGYAHSFPNNFFCLVDSYDTLNSGIPNFLCVAFALIDAGYEPKGVRLDSGDLAKLSKECKKKWLAVGEKLNKNTKNFKIFASNDINEASLAKLRADNHEIDSFGIGTNLVTCQKQPALGLVYKLVEFNNVARLKLSDEISKLTLPSRKNIYRIWVNEFEYPVMDIITLYTEPAPKVGEDYRVVNLDEHQNRYLIKPKKIEKILNEIYKNGKLLCDFSDMHKARKYNQEIMKNFNPEVLKNNQPMNYPVLASEEFYRFFYEAKEKLFPFKEVTDLY